MEIPPQYKTDSKLIHELYRIFYHVHNTLYKFNISYYASGGTLIGALRHGGIIPFDNDVDLEISYKDADKILSREFKREIERHGYKVKLHKESSSKEYNGRYDWIKIIGKRIGKNRPDVDLFFTETIQDNDGKYYNKLTGYAGEIFHKNVIESKYLYPLKRAQFGNSWIPVPNRAEKILNLQYGKSWKNKAYITMDPNTHYPLEQNILVKSKKFYPATPMYNGKRQIDVNISHPLMSGKYLNSL